MIRTEFAHSTAGTLAVCPRVPADAQPVQPERGPPPLQHIPERVRRGPPPLQRNFTMPPDVLPGRRSALASVRTPTMTPLVRTSVPSNAVTHRPNVVFNGLFKGTTPQQSRFRSASVGSCTRQECSSERMNGVFDPGRGYFNTIARGG